MASSSQTYGITWHHPTPYSQHMHVQIASHRVLSHCKPKAALSFQQYLLIRPLFRPAFPNEWFQTVQCGSKIDTHRKATCRVIAGRGRRAGGYLGGGGLSCRADSGDGAGAARPQIMRTCQQRDTRIQPCPPVAPFQACRKFLM